MDQGRDPLVRPAPVASDVGSDTGSRHHPLLEATDRITLLCVYRLPVRDRDADAVSCFEEFPEVKEIAFVAASRESVRLEDDGWDHLRKVHARVQGLAGAEQNGDRKGQRLGGQGEPEARDRIYGQRTTRHVGGDPIAHGGQAPARR